MMEERVLKIGNSLSLWANRELCNDAMRQLFRGFTFRSCTMQMNPVAEMTVCSQGCSAPALPEGKEYRVRVDENGLGITARDYPCLARAFLTVLGQIFMVSYADGNYTFGLPYGDYTDNYKVKNRMIHLCVFPETDYAVFRRWIRLCALCQYTHICVEFWGMFRFSFCDALSWEQAYTKEQVRDALTEMRQLGAEPIPMFNSFGHAAASRDCSGKHVVLDRYPEYQYLFTPDGWAYSVFQPEVKAFLRKARAELRDVFGKTAYFHLGCDENYQTDEAYLRQSHAFIRDLCQEVLDEGITPIIWADECLYPGQFEAKEVYSANGKNSEFARRRLEAIPRGTVLADWQYDVTVSPMPTTVFLQNEGFRVLGCPWYKEAPLDSFLAAEPSEGIMITTWHTLGERSFSVWRSAEKMGAVIPSWLHFSNAMSKTAGLMRRCSEGLDWDYTTYGYIPYQLG